MKITFGLSLDGYEPLRQEDNLGVVAIGPTGMLDLLEIRLGLSGNLTAERGFVPAQLMLGYSCDLI